MLSIIFSLFILEIFVRVSVTYEPGYYSAIQDARGEFRYPYGVIRINSLGFPDDEFDLADRRPRVAYVGDSVTFGVGAGYGYRISDILKRCYPQMQHFNISGGLGTGVTAKNIQDIIKHATELNINTIVYLLNLNDISPGGAEELGVNSDNLSRLVWFRSKLDVLRGKSYLYTYVRNIVTTIVLSNGLREDDISYELYPNKYYSIIDETARRVLYLADTLRRTDKKLIVVVLPYEMQISAEAENIYRKLGVKWGSGFIEGKTQQRIIEDLSNLSVFDAREAFLANQDVDAERKRNRIGQYFVYNRGGRLDWDHPIREGHSKIAYYLVRKYIFGEKEQKCLPES